jgi:hypothetical protein
MKLGNFELPFLSGLSGEFGNKFSSDKKIRGELLGVSLGVLVIESVSESVLLSEYLSKISVIILVLLESESSSLVVLSLPLLESSPSSSVTKVLPVELIE